MPNDDRARLIPRRTPESAAMVASVRRAMAITPALNRLTFDDADEIRAVFSDLIGNKVDDRFSLIPPFYTSGGENIRVGCNVFINQNCTMYDLGGIDIADDVMIGPNVSLITSGHPIKPSERHAFVIAKPIVIERNVWIAAGATIIGGVTVGETQLSQRVRWSPGTFHRTPLSEETRRGSFVRLATTEGDASERRQTLSDGRRVALIGESQPRRIGTKLTECDLYSAMSNARLPSSSALHSMARRSRPKGRGPSHPLRMVRPLIAE
jgi:hypothetical protein